MAGQIYEGDDLGGLLADFGPVQASSMTIWFVHHLGTGRERWPLHSQHFLLSPLPRGYACRYVYVSPLRSHLSLLVEAQDIVAHTAGPATLHLVLVPEELLAGKAPAIVQFPVRQHSQ